MRFRAAAVFAAFLLLSANSHSSIAALQARFQREADPVRKATLLAKLGTPEMNLISRAAAQNNYSGALSLLEQYRDQVTATQRLLRSSGLDAERKPSGFKDLQISVRENIVRLRNLVFDLPPDQQAPFQAAQQDLENTNRALLNALFPRQPGITRAPPSPATRKP